MSAIMKTLALAAFVGVLGASGLASAKTQQSTHEHATHEHAAPVERSHGQQNNQMSGTDIPRWMFNFDRSSNGSAYGQ
jgi:hypothetical protein